jgi:Tol biopolymer transport system component
MRVALRTAACLALAVTAGCSATSASGPARHTAGTAAPAAAATASTLPSAGAGGGYGELAYIAYGKLYVLGGAPAGPRRVALPGIPFAPAWSADHRWLAVEVSKPPPASQPYLQEPATVWLVNAAGTSARQLTPASWQISSLAWAPNRDVLAVGAYLPQAPQTHASLAATVTPAGRRHVLATATNLTGPAWSPDGARIAVGVATFTGGQWHSTLDLLGLTGGPPTVVTASSANVLEVAAWWPDGAGQLYWPDVQGSASIAADGLPLYSVVTGGPGPRTLVRSMLVHQSWLAFSPPGNAVAVVAGGDREIWSGGKQISLCSAAGDCKMVAQPASVVSLDPCWSASGTAIVFARLSAAGPFGPDGRADFTPYWVTRWEATSRLWTVSADGLGARPLAGAGSGAVDPACGRDGSLLFVRDDSLWLLPPGAAAATRLTGTLGALSGAASYLNYYGYVPYPQLFAWTLSEPDRS